MKNIVNIILSGGSGTRLWPLSRTNKPKQFLPIFEGKSLFQHTLIRNKAIVSDFILITNETQYEQAEKQLIDSGIDLTYKIIEPVGRNTAPAIALAALSVAEDAILFVTPSDHMTADQENYKACVSKAVTLADEGAIVTFGIKPTSPHTGYGYIEFEGSKVLNFREKPSAKDAELFLEQGNFYWNSGMFCFKASVFLDELKKYQPNMLQACKEALKTIENGKVGLEAMQQIPADSIDYAVLEQSNLIKTIPSNFYWTDLGSFDAIINYFNEDNKVDGLQVIENENGNSYAFTSKKIVGAGVENLIIVETKDSILVLPKGESDLVKGIHNSIKKNNLELL